MTLRCYSLVAVFACLSWSAVARADEADKVPADKVVPAKSLLFVSIPSVPELQSRFESSMWHAMWNDPGLKSTRGQLEKEWKVLEKGLQDEFQLKTSDVWKLFEGEVSIVMARLGRGEIAGALIMEISDSSETLTKLLDDVEDRFERDDDFEREAKEVEETSIVRYVNRNDDTEEVGWFRKDGYLVVATSEKLLESVLARWDGQNTDVLAERDEYRYIMNRCWKSEEAPALRWFVDPVLLLRTSAEAGDNALQQATFITILSQLGLNSFKGVGGTLDLATEKHEMVNEVLFCVDPPVTGALQLLQGDAISQPIPGWVRADTSYCVSVNWDVMGAWNASRAMVDQFQGPGAFDQMIDGVAEHEAGPKIHPKRDLVDNLTGRIVVESKATTQVADDLDDDFGSREFVIGIGVKDSQKMRDVLSKLSAVEGSPLKSRAFLDTTLYEVELLTPQPITLAVDEGMLFIANGPQRVEEIARGTKGSEQLGQTLVFERLRSESPERVSAWGIERLGLQIGAMLTQLNQLRDLLQQDLSAEGIEGDWVPDPKVFEKYALDRWFYLIPDERGVYWKDFILKGPK